MSTVIRITGPPGSGKSTIARRVAAQFPKSLHLQLETMPKAGWIVLD